MPSPAASTTGKPRDAQRSRAAILAAAELLFAERGFAGTSLAEIGAKAGVSRGTPSYFFGSKDKLYLAVLERIFAERQAATAEAFTALDSWVRDGSGSLQGAVTGAVEGYFAFLLARPAFVRLLQQEDLAGGRHLRTAARESQAMADSLNALRHVAPARGLRRFDVRDALLLFISLTFSPLTQRATFLASLKRDLDDPVARRRHIAFAVDQIMHLLTRG